MAEKFSKWDAADYIDDLDDIATYLQVALEDSQDDPAILPLALGTIARSRNFSELARRVGMSREGLYKALSEGGNPSFATVAKVAQALGLRLELHAVA